jgi:AbrB family looped-hinge helix DNA binding protein
MMGMKARVSEKGQVTIPKRLRDRLGIHAGDVIEFSEQEGALVGRRLLEGDPVAAVTGTLAQEWAFPDLSTDAFLDLVRGPADVGEPTP